MDQGNVPKVVDIQSECYKPEIIEGEALIRARLDVSPDTAWIAEDADGVRLRKLTRQ
jgi:hypothetical protein